MPRAAAPLRAEYAKTGPSLLWLALSASFLTVITLGLYRFWMTTRLRRHYWAAVRVMGDPFEYTGTGLEKMLGFLVAIIILAVYLSVVNLGFAFAGLVQFDDPLAVNVALNLSIIATLPLYYFASYRARRYVMARTRWRGIRFGMERAAWAYAGRAVLLSLLTVVTLGILYPLQHFRLAKFSTDRTWFGDLRFEQGGTWRGLMAYWVWVYGSFVAAILGAVVIVQDPRDPIYLGVGALMVTAGYGGAFLLGLRYRVVAFRYFWDNRRLGGARFVNDIDTGEVVGVTLGGSMAAGLTAMVLTLVVLGALTLGAVYYVGTEEVRAWIIALRDGTADTGAALWPMVVGGVLFYLLLIGLAVAFTQVFVVRPILRRKAEGMVIRDPAILATARQRRHDEALEAGGFADALGVDIGSGF